MKRVWIGGVAWLVCCAAAANASAATYCVLPENSGCDHTFMTVQAALNKAGTDTSADTVKLGAVTYSDGPFTLTSSNQVAIVGQDQGQTVLTASGGTSGVTALTLSDPSSTLTGVGIVVPPGGTPSQPNIGLKLAGAAARIAIKGSSGTTSIGVEASTAGSNAVLEDSTITASNGLVVSGVGSVVTLTARHDTIIGDGSTGSVGASATASTAAAAPGGDATLTLDDSILQGFATDFASQGASGVPPPCVGLVCEADATINVAFDDLDAQPTPSSAPSAINNNGNNVTKPPGFVNAGASLPDYHLLYNSPLIDAGMATVESGESNEDADGNPRTIGSATDIGAYEYQHRPPVITMNAPSPTAGDTNTQFRFSASAGDPDPGDTVTVRWSLDDGGTASGASVTHAFSTPGTHTATSTATDSSGLTASTSTTVAVVKAAAGGGPTGPTGPGAIAFPVIANLKVTPTVFRAATSGGSIAAAGHRTGATISYTDTEAGNTMFIVEQAVTGIKRGRSCVQPPRKAPKHSRRCTLFVSVGGFSHRDVAGANRFHFTGRVFGTALSPGRYRLDALPQNSALLIGNQLMRPFRIIPPPHKRRRHR